MEEIKIIMVYIYSIGFIATFLLGCITFFLEDEVCYDEPWITDNVQWMILLSFCCFSWIGFIAGAIGVYKELKK